MTAEIYLGPIKELNVNVFLEESFFFLGIPFVFRIIGESTHIFSKQLQFCEFVFSGRCAPELKKGSITQEFTLDLSDDKSASLFYKATLSWNFFSHAFNPQYFEKSISLPVIKRLQFYFSKYSCSLIYIHESSYTTIHTYNEGACFLVTKTTFVQK